MKLSQLLDCVSCISITGDTGIEITSLIYDSRQAETGSVFVALNGARTDAHEYIADAVHKGACAVVTEQNTHAVMEVSSQGLKQHRTGGFVFDYGIFLNISPDHIGPGEHRDFNEYLECKKLLLKNCRIGIVNRDMPQLERILEGHFCAVETFGLGDAEPSGVPGLADMDHNTYGLAGTSHVTHGLMDTGHVTHGLTVSRHCLLSSPGVLGTEFETGGILKHVFRLILPGTYNICNALAAILTCHRLRVPHIS